MTMENKPDITDLKFDQKACEMAMDLIINGGHTEGFGDARDMMIKLQKRLSEDDSYRKQIHGVLDQVLDFVVERVSKVMGDAPAEVAKTPYSVDVN